MSFPTGYRGEAIFGVRHIWGRLILQADLGVFSIGAHVRINARRRSFGCGLSIGFVVLILSVGYQPVLYE